MKNSHKVKRPRNAFILFRMEHQKLLPVSMNISEKSKVIAAKWNSMPQSEKLYWQNLADEERRIHKIKYPDYQYNKTNRMPFTLSKDLAPVGLDYNLRHIQNLDLKPIHTYTDKRPRDNEFALPKYTPVETQLPQLTTSRNCYSSMSMPFPQPPIPQVPQMMPQMMPPPYLQPYQNSQTHALVNPMFFNNYPMQLEFQRRFDYLQMPPTPAYTNTTMVVPFSTPPQVNPR